jgi:hypothetical protein
VWSFASKVKRGRGTKRKYDHTAYFLRKGKYAKKHKLIKPLAAKPCSRATC